MRWLLIPWLALAPCAAAESLQVLLERLVDEPHVELVEAQRDLAVRDHLIALGAMAKIRGVWAPRDAERQSGVLSRFTWRVLDGVPSSDLQASVEASLPESLAPILLFSCDGRACGSSAQWANRRFSQRILYGTATSQQYRVYRLQEASAQYRLMLYASARSADRQYMHAELLELDSGASR